MNANTKTVQFGTKQEAVITPKEGYEVESVTVINTANNQIVPSELTQTSKTPAQWKCSFIQPAASVSIKPVIRPIVYSVTIEMCDNCNIVLLENNSSVDVEIKSLAAEETDSSSEENDNTKDSSVGFNHPQHSVNEDAETALDVEGSCDTTAESDIVSDEVDYVEKTANDNNETNNDLAVESGSASQVVDNNMSYAAGEFEDELEDVEPIVITQKEYDDKNTLFWEYREAFDAKKISQEEFDEVHKKHAQFMNDVSDGKIIVK